MNIQELARVFEKLGAREPMDWAKSEIEEGIPQLARFLFLRQAWRAVVSEEGTAWIDAAIRDAHSQPDAPFSGVGQALERLRGLGARDEDLVDLVRGMQASLLFSLCYLLEDSGEVEEEVAHVQWSLEQLDGNGHPIAKIAALHESVLETDPTGREMRPRLRP